MELVRRAGRGLRAILPAGRAEAAKQPRGEQSASDEVPSARRRILQDAFGRSFWIFSVLAVASGVACFYTLGADEFVSALEGDVKLLMELAPRFVAAVTMAAFAQKLLPRDKIARYVSDEAGGKAVAVAGVVGAMTPGGPMTSFPILRALRDAGTGRSVLVAYLTSWSTLGFQRIVSWELPFMGPEFTALRVATALPLPFLAGAFARLWPMAKKGPAKDA